jgi:hypothetical protein
MIEQKFVNKAKVVGYLLGAAVAVAIVIFKVVVH